MPNELVSPILGGVLISFSLFAFAIINNTNISIGRMLRITLETTPSVSWNNQVLFLIGLIVSPITFTTLFYPLKTNTFHNEPIIISLSGLMVGIGYTLCNGGLITRSVCTSIYNIKTSFVVISLFLFFGWLSQFLLTLLRF